MAEKRKWANFAAKMSAKRQRSTTAKKKGGQNVNEEIVVQRMSSSVSGKAQKYNRIGPREFVPFEKYEGELTLQNIIDACQTHFAKRVDKDMVCDVLAGEQGPSCRKVEHIPDLKVIYVRFVKRCDLVMDESQEECLLNDNDDDYLPPALFGPSDEHSVKRPIDVSRCSESPVKCHSLSRIPDTTKKPIKAYPKSLSVIDMLNLGREISKSSTIMVTLHSFDLSEMGWTQLQTPVLFRVDEEPFGSGGFRNAYKAQSTTSGFNRQTWVVKKFLPEAILGMEAMGQTVEGQTRKAVQMHSLAQNFALQLKEKIRNEKLIDFGATFEYNNVYMGKVDGGGCLTVEEYIDGKFVKYLNNNGDFCEEGNVIVEKAECYAHFTYEKSEGKLIVLDLQGSKYTLYDPEISSSELHSDDGKMQFCNGNLAANAMKNFFANHNCNFYCKLHKLHLRPYGE